MPPILHGLRDPSSGRIVWLFEVTVASAAGEGLRRRDVVDRLLGPTAGRTGVVKTQLYRPNLFGRWASPATQDIMRGRSPWTVGERELFAAWVSRLLQCPF